MVLRASPCSSRQSINFSVHRIVCVQPRLKRLPSQNLLLSQCRAPVWKQCKHCPKQHHILYFLLLFVKKLAISSIEMFCNYKLKVLKDRLVAPITLGKNLLNPDYHLLVLVSLLCKERVLRKYLLFLWWSLLPSRIREVFKIFQT
jgi:hypothetical protein